MSEKNEDLIPEWPALKIGIQEETGRPMLKWQPLEGVTEYEIFRATSKNGRYIRMWTVTETVYTNSTANPGVTYYYQVRPVGENLEPSNVAYITCDCARPVVTAATSEESGKPVLTWEAIRGADSYEIYRAKSKKGKYYLMWTVKGCEYVNTTAEPGATYFYQVRAICEKSHFGDSAMSRPVYITCDCARPCPTVESDSMSGESVLVWDPVPGASKYEIHRAANADGTFIRICVVDENSYPVPSLEPGETWYKVSAVNEKTPFANSALSQPVCVFTE